MSLPSAFHDLPADAFPMTMRFTDEHGEVMWEATIEGPAAVYIPPLRGWRLLRIEFANGEVTEERQ